MSTKVIKGITVLFLMLITICALTLSVFAYEPYITPGELKTKTIKFLDSQGEALTSLVPGEITVSTTAKSFFGDNNATLVVCIYKDNEMVAYETDGAKPFAFGKALPLETTITVPQGADSLVAFVWDDINKLFPYCFAK